MKIPKIKLEPQTQVVRIKKDATPEEFFAALMGEHDEYLTNELKNKYEINFKKRLETNKIIKKIKR